MKYVSIDIGGSAIKVAIIDSFGKIYDKTIFPTPKTNFDDLMTCLIRCVEWGKNITSISGIALSQPCVTDGHSGEAKSEGALIYIKDKNPAKRLGEVFDLPYAAENDGNCAALAEIWIGGAKDLSNIALVVCGTGIGGAVVIDRQIFNGHRRYAGEFGMMFTERDALGKPITWSENGSTYAVVKRYAILSNQDENLINGKFVFDAADHSDASAKLCVEKFYENFAIGIHNIQHVYDPQMILIGGAISSREDFIIKLNQKIEWLYGQIDELMSKPVVATCTCGADANLIGAVYHLLNQKK